MSIEIPRPVGRPAIGARRITIRVPEETVAWAEHVARATGTTTVAVLRGLIEKGREAAEM